MDLSLLIPTLCALFLFLGNNYVQAKQPYRTAFHFQPPRNFMNDPNGPMFYRGIYHLFYQYNPKGHGSSNGSRIWGHATSTDLINWDIQPETLKPQMPANNKSSISGSATILPDKPVIIFTGLNSQNQEVQNLAVPSDLSDPYLKEWDLFRDENINPIMFPTPENRIDPNNFRDPTTAWRLPDGRWRLVVGSVRKRRGLALLFRSKDFIHWVKVKHALYSEKLSGVWECPDFYPNYINGKPNVGADTSIIGPYVKHVFKVSLITTNQHDPYQNNDYKHDVYTIGTYDINKDRFIPYDNSCLNDSSLRYDHGIYYASKTFYDSNKKRRVLLAWVKEAIPDNDSAKLGWAGIQAIPRSVWLDRSGKQLIQWPVREIERLRGKQVSMPSKLLERGSLIEVTGITAAQADVEISFQINNYENVEKFESKWRKNADGLCEQNGVSVNGVIGPFGLLTLTSNGLEEHTGVFFRIFNSGERFMVLVCSDQRRSTLSPNPEKKKFGAYVDIDPKHRIFLRVLIDHSVVESFVGFGKTVITARVYPTLAIDDNAHLYIFNNGTNDVQLTSFSAWSMKKARIV